MGTMHHLQVGCADCSVIKTTNGATFLVDSHDIEKHEKLLPTSKKLRGVFITHQHNDHYSGLRYLRDEGFTIDELIYSPYERRRGDNSVTLDEWNEFNDHRDHFKKKGTNCHTPYRQNDFSKPFWKTDGLKFEIIGPAKSVATSDSREIHDACLVIKAILNERKCLFTGDASDTNLEYIANNTNFFCNDILHASHHGSINGAHLDFVKKCNANYTVISTESNVYPNIPHSTALNRYDSYTKEAVYRTDKIGSVKWTF